MHIQNHTLPGVMPGTQHVLNSYHFGKEGSGPHVYLQAGLHADELPGVVLLHRLCRRLELLEGEGRIRGRLTVVPMANPQGMTQHLQGQHSGRFDGVSAENFNRHYPDLSDAAAARLDATADSAKVRQALRQALVAQPAVSTIDALRHTLFDMALQADMVLDVHCDSEAVLHLYGNNRHQAAAGELAGFLQAGATLLCDEAGGMSFDDAVVQNWRRLEQRLGVTLAIPLALTVELRGVADVEDRLAARDEGGLLAWLRWVGVLEGEKVAPPQAPQAATPLAGVETIVAPHGGVVVYQATPGQVLVAGSRIGYLLNPLDGSQTPLLSQRGGYFYARVANRLATTGAELVFLAGAGVWRNGNLLSA
ncbi:succinylglutamate desuccinylase/aspartoacylase domain-containing protein [Vogesella indigofera]|uniref:succinylglutamate desuccinylase/aspartoacylase domain-containing protein n=1 Tax=Vogesella indigofera TaxID=45465 RepID=UPI00234E4285|nr:succinylglutamate desuccinylase/aspartoacylase family protein [Vogesella indigofera]MDC7699873.1 succinylglutamate desuccinylase/aspartoacylase family protein [Vogesella indigofera]